MNKTDTIKYEYIKAIRMNPVNASLYNDYAVFLHKYKKDVDGALFYLNRAIKFDPHNKVYRTNVYKILKSRKTKVQHRYYVLSLIVAAVMVWIGCNGYTNIMNLLSLFVLVQIVLNYQNNFNKIYLK